MTLRRRMRLGARARLYDALERWPWGFRAYVRSRRHPTGFLMDEETEIVVDGYPSSGNSFARNALLAVNPGLSVASHVHIPAHLVAAVRLGLPAVVVVRDPLDAVASYLVRGHGPKDPAEALWRYVWFHRRLLPHLGSIVVGRFDRVVTEFGTVVEEVNRRFGCDLVPFPHDDPEAVATVTEGIGESAARRHGSLARVRMAAPDAGRERSRETMRQWLLERDDLTELRRSCTELHHAITAGDRA